MFICKLQILDLKMVMKQVIELVSTVLIAASLMLLMHNHCLGVVAQAPPVTDPSEARALTSLYQQWEERSSPGQWNISNIEPCQGAAVVVDTNIEDPPYNPFFMCDCSYDGGSTCHVTKLWAVELSITGQIPDELWTLTYLDTLILARNLLMGPLSPSIGNLTRLEELILRGNLLTGELPKELGRLTSLTVLGFGTNKFSGALPAELGNITKLQKLFLTGNNVSGPIPLTFAKFTSLQVIRLGDTGLNGKIPDFVGKWTGLTDISIYGTSFEGPIPSALLGLSSLQTLRISDLSGNSSTLAFLKGMTNLSSVTLRNNNISGSIPYNIGDFQSLLDLDLSFNNLIGEIPESIYRLPNLTHLFLGNNRLTGVLPAQIVVGSSHKFIDLSYNNLHGNLPLWVSQPNLQINLVANNFTVGDSNGGLPSGLGCLQQSFSCNQNPPFHNFAIKCGGEQTTSSDGIVYEADNSPLSAATYYVADSKRWAVSNVGYFKGNTNPQFIFKKISPFTNTIDPQLFTTARVSPSSLRYYGLGLENGNYTVVLQFAETAIADIQWGSLGRRVFDIYLQSELVEKDFDIKNEAGGASLKAVVKNYYKVQVTENYLVIHLFWAGKGSSPTDNTYGPMISAITATADFKSRVPGNILTAKKNKAGLIAGVTVGIGAICIMAALLIFYLFRTNKRVPSGENEDFQEIPGRAHIFSYEELKSATDNFSPLNKLGEGGFGPVFMGTFADGRAIAAKLLSVPSKHGRSQFATEISTVSAVQHRNLVKLYGCCNEGSNQLIVYEYLENKSLDQALYGEKNLNLNWSTRYEICLGVARGLAYLHEELTPRIIHRDVKTSNILLDSDLTPKISDFGLAKLYGDEKTHISTRIAGTLGYIAPEYALRGHLTEKADVFAFGVVALEVVSGRHNCDPKFEEDKVYLLEWAWKLHEIGEEIKLVDPRLSKYNNEEVKRVVAVGLLCTQTSPVLRPTMSRVVSMLSGDVEVTPVSTRPGYLTDWKYNSMSDSSQISAMTPLSKDTDSFFRSASSLDAGASGGPDSFSMKEE